MKYFIVFALVTLLGISSVLGQGNPMFSTEETPSDSMISISLDEDLEAADTIQTKPVMMESEEHGGFFKSLLRMNADYQKMLRSNIADRGKAIDSDGGIMAVSWILLISFLYGIIHSLGPGHNKVVVFSYFLTQKPKIRDGILMGNITAFIHALSGLTVALMIFYVIKETTTYSFDQSQVGRWTMVFSFGFIIIIGLFLLVGYLKDYFKGAQSLDEKASSKKSILAMAFSVGIIPCPGTMILTSFLLTLGFVKLSVFAALFMALGMGFTISMIALLSVLIKKQLLRFLKNDQQVVTKFQLGISIFGSLLIIFIGVVFLLGVL